MALVYTRDKHSIRMALQKLKDAGLVSRDACFNEDAPEQLRKEVTYRDFDFLLRLGRIREPETIRSILEWLKQKALIDPNAAFDEDAFEQLRREVRDRFSNPGTSVTPVMERLLYMLSAVRRPRRIIGLGTYYGYALTWIIGPSWASGGTYETESVCGIDIDAQATEHAKDNFRRLGRAGKIEMIAEDGLDAVKRLDGPFDCVYLDVDCKDVGKGLYLDLLRKLYEKIEEGGWVLAHDTVCPPFAGQLKSYLAYVRDRDNFKESISFDVDAFGLELSVK